MESRDIYLGAIPFIVIQLFLVAIVIFFPQSVTMFLDKPKTLDIDKAIESIQQMDSKSEPKADPMQGLGAPAPAASAAEEDPMEAVRRSLREEAAKGKQP